MLFILLSYIYHSKDWEIYPFFWNVKNFTADTRYVYIVTSSFIVQYDEITEEIKKVFSAGDKIPHNIHIAGYDDEKGILWVVSKNRELFEFNPSTLSLLKDLKLDFLPKRIMTGKNRVGFSNNGKTVWYDKYTFQRTSPPPSWTTYGYIDKDSLEKLIFLSPFYLMDREFHTYPFTAVFFSQFNIYAGAQGYGIAVYDRFSRIKKYTIKSKNPGEIFGITKIEDTIFICSDSGIFCLFNKKIKFMEWNEIYKGWLNKIRIKNKYKKIKKLSFSNSFPVIITDDNKIEVIEKNTIKTFYEDSKLKAFEIYDLWYDGKNFFLATEKGAYVSNGEKLFKLSDRKKMLEQKVYKIKVKNDTIFFIVNNWIVKWHNKNWYYSPFIYLEKVKAIDFNNEIFGIIDQRKIKIFNSLTNTKEYITLTSCPIKEPSAIFVDNKKIWIVEEDGIAALSIEAIF